MANERTGPPGWAPPPNLSHAVQTKGGWNWLATLAVLLVVLGVVGVPTLWVVVDIDSRAPAGAEPPERFAAGVSFFFTWLAIYAAWIGLIGTLVLIAGMASANMRDRQASNLGTTAHPNGGSR